jgi:NAD+ kinase
MLFCSLLVATPTGSTAYSLGGGGAIVHPEIDAIMLTPLNSMSLSSRPLVLPGRAVIKLKVLLITALHCLAQ